MSKHVESEVGYIYIAECDFFIKIGHSRNPIERVASLLSDRRTLRPNGVLGKCRGKYYFAGTRQMECQLHAKLRHHAIAGTNEWYARSVLRDKIVTDLPLRLFRFFPGFNAYPELRFHATDPSYSIPESAVRLTPKEAAQQLGVCTTIVSKHIGSERLKAELVDGRWYIDQAELDRFKALPPRKRGAKKGEHRMDKWRAAWDAMADGGARTYRKFMWKTAEKSTT